MLRHRKDDPAHAIPADFAEMLVYEGTTALVPLSPDHDTRKRVRKHQVLGDAA
jgi:hypothetical protein